MRRALRLLLAASLLGLAALSGGCSSGQGSQVVVLGPWTGPEGAAFESVLRELSRGSGHRYVYQGTRSLRETLVAQLAADAPPDVAILNSIGELTEYAAQHKLKPLDPSTAERGYPPWTPTLMADGRSIKYWVPLKVDLKSLVWSRTGSSSTDPRWCVGMAAQATSGWPGTDWVEDILLHQAGPHTYTQWATGQLDWAKSPEVRRAFTTWAQLLRAGGPRNVERALTMSFWGTPAPGHPGGDPRGLLGSSLPDCTHEHQGSFIRYVYAPRSDVRVEPAARFLKGSAAYRSAFEVSGDMAAVLTDNPGAQQLVKRLTSEDGREQWSGAARPHLRPFFPDRSDPQPADNPAAEEIARYLVDEKSTLCFDASDVMPPVLRDAFYRAVLEYFRSPDGPTLTKLLNQLETVRTQIAGSQTPGDMRAPTDICR
ncbi:extracellular solute-binding protein [Streptomyces sp. SID14478]|uniref:extracellular solute-binding protein n=1 Tax=Streptomyces sp. SID14478 TaxID=2706073 RepID=UPI0013D92AC5|nr:extracellular solute-binding protein [Streptomyces sp. SID14478]NEB79356.1 extracellular solute-binding protein [Streptomyces sp. SID14478]